MKKVRKTITRYLCGTCGTEYEHKKAALACENLPVEKQKFFSGDMVEVVGKLPVMTIHTVSLATIHHASV